MSVWGRAAEIVRRHGAAALVSVHAVRGSAPREAGARIVMRPDGAFHGTIGGGRLEWEALAAARDALEAGRGPARFVDHALGPDLGQCCGGHVRLLVETFGAEDLEAIEGLAALEAQEPFEASCQIDDEGRVARRPASTLDEAARSATLPWRGTVGPQARGGVSDGSGQVSRAELHPAPVSPYPDAPRRPSPSRRGWEAVWTEAHGEHRTPLLLFGAGHVGRALVLALAPLPFRVRWIDTRPNAFPPAIPASATPVRTEAPEAEIAAAPAGAFVLVMTHDHALDLAVTAAALARPDLPFVGLIGSATKRARFERRFRELRLAPDRVAALACPIGLPGIEGKEPAIIAAATAAQLLAERERARPSPRSAEPATNLA